MGTITERQKKARPIIRNMKHPRIFRETMSKPA